MLYINAEDIHTLNALSPSSSLLTIQFSLALFDEVNPPPRLVFSTAERPFTARDNDVYQNVISLLTLLVDQNPSFQRFSVIYALLDTLVRAGQVSQRSSHSLREEQMFKKGLTYINDNYAENITLTDVSNHTGMSYSWFSRSFKKASSYNFKEYLTLIRLNKAKLLLRDTCTSITDISDTCGFREHKYLISAFRTYCGVTPTEYRKRFFSGQSFNKPHASSGSDFVCLPLNMALVDAAKQVHPSIDEHLAPG